MSLKFLKETFIELVAVDSPYGFEEPMIRHFKEALAPYVDEVIETPRGNVVGVQRGTVPEAPKVALAAHMDQVGFTVFNIGQRGFIRFRKVGGASNRAILGQRVRLATEKGSVPGVPLISSSSENPSPSLSRTRVPSSPSGVLGSLSQNPSRVSSS